MNEYKNPVKEENHVANLFFVDVDLNFGNKTNSPKIIVLLPKQSKHLLCVLFVLVYVCCIKNRKFKQW